MPSEFFIVLYQKESGFPTQFVARLRANIFSPPNRETDHVPLFFPQPHQEHDLAAEDHVRGPLDGHDLDVGDVRPLPGVCGQLDRGHGGPRPRGHRLQHGQPREAARALQQSGRGQCELKKVSLVL